MRDSMCALLCTLLCTSAASVLAFHPDDTHHVDDFQCAVCNASYYCKNGERYACPANSMALDYADTVEECICNPGYLSSNFGLLGKESNTCPCGYTCGQCSTTYTRSTKFQTALLRRSSRYLRCVQTQPESNKAYWDKKNADWLNIDACAGYKYYAFECGELYCVRDGTLPDNQYTIPDGNCLGQPELTTSLNGGSNSHCVSPSYPNTANDGTALGGWHRAAVYELSDPSALSCECRYCINCVDFTCNLGLSPHWYLYGQRNSCPATKVVAWDGSSTADDCVCPPGSYSQANRSLPCLPCPPGTFADKHNMSQCTPCPANSWHDKTNQTNISVCLCNAGWVGVAANGCVECAIGTYETASGTSILDCRVCKLCNTTTNAAFTDHYDAAREGLGCGVSSVEVCTACPSLSSLFRPTTQSQSNFGVRSCVCDENSYGQVGTACTACPVGQNRTGFINENTTLENCQCLPGYEPDPAFPNLCKQCSINMFKAAGGDHNCTACPAGYVTDGRTGQAYCVCATGTEQLDAEGVCQTCRDGRFKNVSTDKYANRECLNCSKFCSDCNQLTYDFSPYPVYHPWKDYAAAVGFPGSSMFSYGNCYGSEWMGMWNNAAWMTGIMPAAYNFVQVAFYFVNCGEGGSVVLSIDGVTKATSYGNTVVYKQKYSVGQSLRLQEFSGYQQGGIGRNLIISFSTCEDFYVSSQTKIERYVTQECYNSSDLLCTLCQTCQPGFYDNQTCGLMHGNDRLDTVCLPCFPDFYCLGAKNPPIKCKLCNTLTNAAFTDHYDAARGGVGCGDASVEVCTQCPSLSSLFEPTTLSQRNFGVRSCVCDQNSYGLVGTACTACPVGQNRTGFIYENTTLSDCQCLPGYDPDPAAANLCRQCPIGKYKPELGDHNCTVCPDTFTTEITGNSNFASCVCRPGYALSTEQVCVICPENTFKVGFNMNMTCPSCPLNSFVAAGAVSHLNCTCVPAFEPYNNVCNLCPTGKYGNISINIGNAMTAISFANQYINLARACSAGNCPVSASSSDATNSINRINDGITTNLFHTAGQEWYSWVLIDMQQTVNVASVRIYNRADCCPYRLDGFTIRVGDSPSFDNNPSCGTHGTFTNYKDFACAKSGRYFSLRNGIYEFLQLQEVEVYGTKNVPDTVKCLQCPLNTFTNNTGVLVCEACAAGKTTDGRTGQVECVCDVGTFQSSNGTCETCPASSFKATITDKYANRGCVTCGSCAVNQQVNTECNNTHNMTCKACQANSWSYAGRTLLDPCFCIAGYELQGEICVACPAGKARQANYSNSIMCETCASGSFTTVTATSVCKKCTANCVVGQPRPNRVKIVDFTGTYSQADLTSYAYGGSSKAAWLAYAASVGATWSPGLNGEGWGGVYGHPENSWVDFPLPSGYSFVETDAPGFFGHLLYIGGVQYGCDQICKVIAPYKPGDKLRFQEVGGSITYAIKLFVFVHNCVTENRYVSQECNASQDITCSCCQTCNTGIYDNNTCGVSYNNNRLDTQCVACPENAFCPGTLDLQRPLLCSEQRCGANQQVATLCNTTHNVTCKACQANSWSYAGRTQLDPCLCNAGYELQGEICVACPVGKARQANNSNSVVCETCGAGTFTSVFSTVSCGACSAICGIACQELIYDFSPFKGMTAWKNYAASIGATTFFDSYGYDGYFVQGDLPHQIGYIQLTLPVQSNDVYNDVKINYYNTFWQGYIRVFINNVLKQSVGPGSSSAYMQTYSSGTVLKIDEERGMLGENLKITLKRCFERYVQQECNASRDVICLECQGCGPGFYANNTCGTNYSNDRLDTQCVACAAGKTTDGRTGQVECVCDVGTEPGADGVCQTCRGGTYKATSTDKYANRACVNCSACAANQQVATECNSTHNITCRACQANSWSYAGRTQLEPCLCNAGYELQGEICVACPVGKARQANANNSIVCETCSAETFTSVSTTVSCGACSPLCQDDNTFGIFNPPESARKYSATMNYDAPGFGFARSILDSAGTWYTGSSTGFLSMDLGKAMVVTGVVIQASKLNDCSATQIEVKYRSDASSGISCFWWGCSADSNWISLKSVTGSLQFFPTATFAKQDKSVMLFQAPVVTQHIMIFVNGYQGGLCTRAGVTVDIMRLFVMQECNASRDVICQKCQTCGPGFYANNTCGENYGNDRLDTQCVQCPGGSYCPGGSLSQLALPCPDNGKSPPGSSSEKACDCDPGFFRDADGCALCPFDAYCPGKQIQHAIACPPDSRTARRGSTSRLDCHCHTGYFRDPPERLDSFNCSLCLPGDFCFNNSAYNCSDALMVSAPGSGFFDNCTCVPGYYNNGTVCEDCPVNYYCEGGKRLSCPANEWTAYEGRSYECVCMPGFYRNQSLCVPCTDDYFCQGLDDSRQACPQHSTGRGASEIEHCLCNSGFEAIFSTNASEPHTCRACEHTGGIYKYKTGLGNRACSQCTECLPHLHSTWTQITCTPTADALCDYCSVCHNATGDSPRLRYTSHACQQFFDTRCANCTVCDWDAEWEFAPCSESGNRVCSLITRDRACPVGFYAGGHTRTTDSRCLPCAVRNTPYEGEWLHHFTSAGRSYGDPYSCDLTCRAFSRLANATDPSFGCTTCETGNVLFKQFTQSLLECQFECLPGYAKRGEDCVLETFHADAQIYWNHSVNVTHVRRESLWNHSGRSAFQLTVSHTAHGNFAVVFGRSEPTCAGRAAVELRAPARPACCFAELWRVSTTTQLGLASTAREQCSRADPPWSARISDTQLVFEVPDARIEELANCSRFGDGLACELHVSIVDALLLHHFSVAVRLELRRAAALSAVGTQTYVPLAGFRVEAQLAYVELDGSPVFVVVSDMAPLPGAGATDVALHSAGLRLAQPPPEANCERYGALLASGLGGTPLLNASAEAWTLGAAPARAVSFLRAPPGTQFLKLFYTLRLREREGAIGTKNMMQVAAWRNLSQVRAVCDLPPPSLSVETGEVLSCSGLGEAKVAAATALSSPEETVRGELGGLASFVARAVHPHVHAVLVKSMLVAFTLPAGTPSVAGVNVTGMHLGDLDFTDEFKAACQTTEFCHFRYVHRGPGMHFLTSCDAAAQDTARAWLRSALGVVEDDGHVQALCGLAHRQSAREYAFLVALVNSRAYLPRGRQWHDLQNHSAPLSTSRVAALFEFV